MSVHKRYAQEQRHFCNKQFVLLYQAVLIPNDDQLDDRAIGMDLL